jgi:hypothetical protein
MNEIQQKLRAGNETIHSAYQKIQKAKRQELLNKPIIYSNDTAPLLFGNPGKAGLRPNIKNANMQ